MQHSLEVWLLLSGLLVLLGLCVLGAVSKVFKDNWLQFLGLCMLALGSSGYFGYVVEHAARMRVAGWGVLFVWGAVFYGLGTVMKTWHHHRLRCAGMPAVKGG